MSKCSYKNLTVYGTSNQETKVTEDFEVGELITDTGLENVESVECDNCNESFEDLYDAREHINQPKEKKNES